MKLVKVIIFAMLVSSVMFLIHLRISAVRPAAEIAADFNIAASMDGSAATEVVADRILAIDGVRDVRVRKAREIFLEYGSEKIISAKIRLEENPFSDHLRVYPENFQIDMPALAQKISATGGVAEISYDSTAVAVYRALSRTALRLMAAAVSLTFGAFLCAAVIIAVKMRKVAAAAAASLMRPLPYLYYLSCVSAACYAGFAILARADGFRFDYTLNALVLACVCTIASVVYAD